MIVKIWPVKGTLGLKKALLYVQDDNKVIQIKKDEEGKIKRRTVIDTQQEFHQDADSFFIENEENIVRVFTYMTNADKVKNKYISGYCCNPDTALTSFKARWSGIAMLAGADKKPGNVERENMSFHMVQSFPEGLDISDEEVHQCGLELLQKLEKHQGIVCSHVHPVVDEDGIVHGKAKHNHILFNAFIMPDKLDPEHPRRVKYNDCKETYAQLQIWNDEIAIDHGLPIIRNPDLDRVYSWKENYEAGQGNSWKERIRLDIEEARRVTGNWREFKEHMEQSGYQIREGTHITYTAPDGEHKVRGGTLGRSYTKESLELYWTIKYRIEATVAQAVRANEAPPLWALVQQYGPLTVDVPLGRKQEEAPPSYPLPLDKSERSREVLSTYFNDGELYDVRNATGRIVASATGRELVDYLEALSRGEQERWEQHKREVDEQEQRKQETTQITEELKRKKNTYSAQFRNSRTKDYYYIDLWDENGRRRSMLELILLLAIVVIQSEEGLWEQMAKIPKGRENEACFGPRDWRLQNMIDAIHVAEQEGIESPEQLDQRLQETGAAYSRARAALTKTRRAQEKMQALAVALDEYLDVRELVERISALPEGPEKTRLQEQYTGEIQQYKKAKAVMYGYHVTTPAQINDFQIRYADIQANLPGMQEQFDRTKEEYRQLKKLRYHVELAQNAQYCYGPAYAPEASEKEPEAHKLDGPEGLEQQQ